MSYRKVAGMAHFPGTGPIGWTCRSCAHWGLTEEERKRGDRGTVYAKPRRCREFKRLTGKEGKPVNCANFSCRHWEKVEADDR